MIIWDTETTGLPKPETCPLDEQPRIIEYAGIKLDDKTLKEKGRMEFICNPGIKLDEVITKITGLADRDLEDKPPFVAFYPKLVDFYLGERSMVAHNLPFDRSLLTFDLMRIDCLTKFPWPPKHICTVEASMGVRGYRLKLELLHEIVTGMKHKDAHRAMNDVEALVTCVRWLRKEGYL